MDRFEVLLKLSEIIYKSGSAPKGCGKPEAVFLILLAGEEVGLLPMQSLSSIMVLAGRPSIYGDAMLALVRASGLLGEFEEGIEGQGDARQAWCRATRPSAATPERIATFSVADAKLAKLWGKPGPWSEYTERQMTFRARSRCLRDLFGDVLRGLIAVEEAEDFPMVVRVVPVVPDSALLAVCDLTTSAKPTATPPAIEVKSVVEAEDANESVETGPNREAEQLAKCKELMDFVCAAKGAENRAAKSAAWLAELQAIFPGVESIKKLNPDQIDRLIKALEKKYDPFT